MPSDMRRVRAREAVKRGGLSRREFLALSAASAAAALTGCATNPATKRRELMLLSESDEVRIDKQNSPHQFSADYGPARDTGLNDYISLVGNGVAGASDRPSMPYSFRVVNAAYVNAYAFPGGSIAATRGIVVHLNNEAELGALLGHEIGHVCARHTAQQMTKSIVAMAAVSGIGLYAERHWNQYAPIAAGLGQVGAGALLARYSRANERQADSLGLAYATGAGLSADGMVGLMSLLKSLSTSKPSAMELMFATHPWSGERYDTAIAEVQGGYNAQRSLPLNRERFMDGTAALRQIKQAIEEMQSGDKSMMAGRFTEAESHFASALRQAPEDYAGLMSMSKCLLAQNRNQEALEYARRARQVYPEEAQSTHLNGVTKLAGGRYEGALEDFRQYERMLPGNPNTSFFEGLCLEKMGRREQSAQAYGRYLRITGGGEHGAYVQSRLAGWGYLTQP